jgi:hypothetical protein
MAKRYLQRHDKRVGRRRGDLPMPASVKSASQIERFVDHIRSARRQSTPRTSRRLRRGHQNGRRVERD